MDVGFLGALVLLLLSCAVVGWQLMQSDKTVRDIRERKRKAGD